MSDAPQRLDAVLIEAKRSELANMDEALENLAAVTEIEEAGVKDASTTQPRKFEDDAQNSTPWKRKGVMVNRSLETLTRVERAIAKIGALFFLCTLPVLGAESPWTPTTDPAAAYGPELQGFEYPYPVMRFEFSSQLQSLHMAYMDVHPEKGNGRTAILFHGKNYCAATWNTTIVALIAAGYRVVAPDQIGFCKSSKPNSYQFTFQQLARNTHALLASLGISHATLIGHSTGGMIAVRYALMYPNDTEQLVLVNPIGLEDWKAKGVPSISVDDWYARELKVNADSVRSYEQQTYFAGQWRPEYEPWVQMYAGLNRGPGKQLVAWNSALIYDMIYTQPVFYELENIAVPTLLMIGDKDNTAIGKNLAPPAVQQTLGHYPELGKLAAARIPGARLVEFPELGHAPQIQDPEAFNAALIKGLSTVASK